MKTKLLIIMMLCFVLGIHAQTTHNISWGFNSTPTAGNSDQISSRTIEVGDTVTWTWITDGGSHNVVSNAGSTETFSSGSTTAAPNTFSHTFTSVGTNDYRCVPHSGIMFGTITVTPALSVDEFRISGFAISPNPARERMNIELPAAVNNAQLQVFDVLGKRIINREISDVDASLNVSNWNNGVYIVRVISNGITQTKRFVKQ